MNGLKQNAHGNQGVGPIRRTEWVASIFAAVARVRPNLGRSRRCKIPLGGCPKRWKTQCTTVFGAGALNPRGPWWPDHGQVEQSGCRSAAPQRGLTAVTPVCRRPIDTDDFAKRPNARHSRDPYFNQFLIGLSPAVRVAAHLCFADAQPVARGESGKSRPCRRSRSAVSQCLWPGRNEATHVGGRDGVAVIRRHHGETSESGSVDGRLRSLTPWQTARSLRTARVIPPFRAGCASGGICSVAWTRRSP